MAKTKSTAVRDMFTKDWIVENAINITSRYRPGDLTIRALHYQLVNIGMTNTIQHYKRVTFAMEYARWAGIIPFKTFSDLDRAMVGKTEAEITDVDSSVENAKEQIQMWIKYYSKNRWENQPIYTELFIEKKALQNVFQGICSQYSVGLGCCKGYPSLTFLYETSLRLKAQQDLGKKCVILYFGDYDPSGEDIPRSIEENLRRMGCDVEIRRFALFRSQVEEWNLPPAPAKKGDSRTANWDGIGQVELDAVDPDKLKSMAEDAILSVFDQDLFDQLNDIEEQEQETYTNTLKEFVKTL